MFEFHDATIVLVGPLPPPSGGMANQTAQLSRLLDGEGASVRVVQTNPPYRPRVIGRIRGVRALFRLLFFFLALRRAMRGATLVHIMANSYWSWHLFAAPALWVAYWSRVPALVNYRGGHAREFFARYFTTVSKSLRLAACVVVPSSFLADVFAEMGVETTIVPNIVDLDRFKPRESSDDGNGVGPRILIARNLEPIYDVETGLRAFERVRRDLPKATMEVAGSGPESARLEAVARELKLGESVLFLGRIDNADMPKVYARCDIALNASLVDNMPNSILEALACGLPVVSTDVGGVPVLIADGHDGVLVPPGDVEKMARALISLWEEHDRRAEMRAAGIEKASRYGWPTVRESWAHVYQDVIGNV